MFRNYCAQCHGAGAAGVVGRYPNLLDDDWLWGGTAADIQATVTHGIRYDADADTRFSQMPAFGDILEPAQIDELTQYVLSLSGQAARRRRRPRPARRSSPTTAPPATARTAPACASSAPRT